MREFILSTKEEILAGQSISFLAYTNDVNIEFDPISITSSVSPIRIELYEAPEPVLPLGTEVHGWSSNFKSKQEHDVQIYMNQAVSFDGVFKFGIDAPGNHKDIASVAGKSFVLKRNAFYLYKIINNSNQEAVVNINHTWIERIKGLELLNEG